MNECYGDAFVLNGVIVPVTRFDNSLIYEGESIYEVLRLSGGLPFFFGDHMERLEMSLVLQKKTTLCDRLAIRKAIFALRSIVSDGNLNLKVVFNYGAKGNNWLVYYLLPSYPTTEQYINGVKGIFFEAERADPGSKVLQVKLREQINRKLAECKAYEALLVNSRGLVTEGSRSNIFFIKNDRLFTAPDEIVLGGITRKYLLDICRTERIDVVYDCINADQAASCESVFMTGTSPMVLPFCLVDGIHFKVDHPVIAHLRDEYFKRAKESLG